MVRATRFLLAALVVSVIASAVAFVWSNVQAEYRSRALWRQVDGGPGTVVDFTQLGPNDWDRLFIFHPYTPSSSIHEALGYEWPAAERSSIGSNDGVNLVVFTRGGRVAGWFEHPRNRGDLKYVARMNGYPRDQARFVVQLDQERRLVLAAR